MQIVATALPTIAEELNTSPSEYQWIGTVGLSFTSLRRVLMYSVIPAGCAAPGSHERSCERYCWKKANAIVRRTAGSMELY